jgi:hypothetical protein
VRGFAGVPDDLALAALADMIGCICEGKKHRDAMLNHASERAWAYAHTVFRRRRSPPPDNVTPLTPRDTKPNTDPSR